MKILLIHNYYRYRGGEETYFESLKKLLKENGHDVITYTKDNKTVSNLADKIKLAKNLFYAKEVEKELANIIETNKPDIAQFQNIFPQITPTAYRICKKYKIPIIQRISNYRYLCPKGILFRNGKICEECITKKFKYPAIVHGCYDNSRLASLFFTSSFYYHKEVLKSFDLVDFFIFPTEFIRDYYVKHAKLDKAKTRIISTFNDINELHKDKSSIQVHETDYFLYFGRLAEEKGIIQLLEIFKNLIDHKLIIIGDGPLKDKVLYYSKYKNIIYKGFLKRKEISAYIDKSIGVIIPSMWYDVMPNTLLESLLHKKLVIIPKFGVFPEIVKNKQGYFYQQYNPVSLKSVIIKAARNRSKKEFYCNKTLKNARVQLFNVYEEALR